MAKSKGKWKAPQARDINKGAMQVITVDCVVAFLHKIKRSLPKVQKPL